MTATKDIDELDRGTVVQATHEGSRFEEGVGGDQGLEKPKVAAGSKKKKKKKKKKNAASSVLIYSNLLRGTFKITENTTAGRCVVAAKDLAPGDIILDEPPFAKVVRGNCALRYCSSCCQQIHEAARIEAGVQYAAYCSRACKDKEAVLRTAEGDAVDKLARISTVRDVDLDLLRMLLRLLVMKGMALGLQPKESKDARSGETGRQECDDQAETAEKGSTFLLNQWHNVRSLMDHREKMNPEWTRVVRAAAEDLMEAVPAWVRSELDEVVGLACRVNVNAHGLRDDSGGNNVIGVGLFPLTAMINHSCRPNCTFLFYGGKMEVRALEAIKAGEELNVHYIDVLQSTPDRRRDLLASKHFVCACSRCENPGPADAYLDGTCCVDCGEGGCLTSTPLSNPEDALAAQLAELGADVDDLGRLSASGGKSKSKFKGKIKGGSGRASGSSSITVTGSGGVSSAPAATSRVRDVDVTGSPGAEGVMYCSACGRQYPAAIITDRLARAKLLWNAAKSAAPAKDLSTSRKALEKWLEDFDAGTMTPPSAPNKKSAKKPRLHPANAMVVHTLVSLANCCNFEKDYSASAKCLKRAISAMERVYPANYPELGDFHAALADALTAFLHDRGEALPKKLKSQTISERKRALERAIAIRSVCLGPEHPGTKALKRALTRA